MGQQILTYIWNILFIVTWFSNCSCQELNDDNICSNNASLAIIANPYDCFSFYVCQYGQAMKIICPNQSMFDPNIGNCDPDYLECSIEETTTDNSTTQDSTTQDSTTQDSTTQDSTTQDSTTQDSTTQDSTTQDSTTQYSTTQDSTTHDSTTQYSTTDNLTTYDSTTDSISTTNTPSYSPTAITSTSPTEDPNNCIDCTAPPPYNLHCPPNDTEIPTFLPSDEFCDSFYLCYHGRPFEMFCSIGFYWSQEKNECILERDSNCTDSFNGSKAPKCPSKGQHFFPHSERCNYFYYCESGIRSIQQCPPFKHWDIIEQNCKMDINARCIKAIPRSQREKYYTLNG